MERTADGWAHVGCRDVVGHLQKFCFCGVNIKLLQISIGDALSKHISMSATVW